MVGNITKDNREPIYNGAKNSSHVLQVDRTGELSKTESSSCGKSIAFRGFKKWSGSLSGDIKPSKVAWG
jgi:hypothetical protein